MLHLRIPQTLTTKRAVLGQPRLLHSGDFVRNANLTAANETNGTGGPGYTRVHRPWPEGASTGSAELDLTTAQETRSECPKLPALGRRHGARAARLELRRPCRDAGARTPPRALGYPRGLVSGDHGLPTCQISLRQKGRGAGPSLEASSLSGGQARQRGQTLPGRVLEVYI